VLTSLYNLRKFKENYSSCGCPFGHYLFFVMMLCSLVALAQSQDPAPSSNEYHFDGSVTVTNNGFSFIPLFSLGKPALVADVSLGGERFSFDPQFRFDLAGLKPWSFIFIWRYQLIRTERVQLKLGAHLPAISFRTMPFESDGETKERLVPLRFITPELTFNYSLSDHISAGTYYIYGLGLEKEDQTRHTHFLDDEHENYIQYRNQGFRLEHQPGIHFQEPV